MFYVVGIGLGDAKDITVKGLEVVKRARRVYLEAFTSILSVGKEELEKFYGRDVVIADRELVEMEADTILMGSETEDVAFLVVGDPFGATTHTDLVLRAKQKGIETRVIHNASIINAIGCCGLQLYNFGETVSIPMWTDTWRPDSFFEKICSNNRRGLHTLCLLDIKVKEPTPESIMKKKKEYLPPTFMTVCEASKQLMEIIDNSSEETPINQATLCVGVARVGSDNQKIISCSLGEMTSKDLGPPLHSLVIVGKLHPMEEEYLNFLCQ